jgi:hypothetical protein
MFTLVALGFFAGLRLDKELFEALRVMRPYLRCKGAEADVVLNSGIAFANPGVRVSEEQRDIRNAVRLQLKALKGVGRQVSFRPLYGSKGVAPQTDMPIRPMAKNSNREHRACHSRPALESPGWSATRT